MSFTDIFIKRPVLAIVVSALIVALGFRSINNLSVQQYPSISSSVITVSTTYTGADPETVAGFITTPLEQVVAQANGIDYMTSSSTQGNSTIQAYLLLNWPPDKALTEINTKISSVLNQLPEESQLPALSISTGQSILSMYLSFSSNVIPSNKVTDYVIRVAQPKIQAVNGVLNAQLLGGRQFAMRAWLDPVKMSGRGVTPADVAQVLANNNFVSAAGRTDGQMFINNLTSNTSLTSVEQFKNIVVKAEPNNITRLQDIADVSLGAQSYDTVVKFDGKSAVYIGVEVAPGANLLDVIDDVKKAFADVQANLPTGLDAEIVYDASEFVTTSIEEVNTTLIEAFIIVSIVIYLFLGSLRSLVVPVIAIPLSLIGTFFMMFILGFTINLLTLLAFVLAIGLVVDDAIIVVENVHRHVDDGMDPLKAALISGRELIMPIIATTVVLIAVYVPIGFMTGLTGALFTEFAFTLASAVFVSTIVALTLSPVMCSKMIKPHTNGEKPKLAKFIDDHFETFKQGYDRYLSKILDMLPVVAVFATLILLSNIFLFKYSSSELAPQEDQGVMLTQLTAAANAAGEQTALYSEEILKTFRSHDAYGHSFQIIGASSGGSSAASLNQSMNGMVLKPWDKRKMTSNQLQPILQQQVRDISGAKVSIFQLPSLPGGGSGLPVQFVIQSTADFNQINDVVQPFVDEARNSGMFMYIDPDLKIDKQQTKIILDNNKIAELGLNMRDIGNTLSASLSQGYINYFNYAGRSYQVIPQMMRTDRLLSDDVLNYYVRSLNGQNIPLSTFAKLKRYVVPQTINHFQQLNSATISAVPSPGVSMGEALGEMQRIAKEKLPSGYSIDYAAQSRQFIQEGTALVATFFFALLVIFLSLAAQFNSFHDPLIILISVPLSICGAMIFICLGVGGATLNIYSQVGLITLIGLISKHGILIVQFANDLQREGKSKREAIEIACSLRLRPILMTTAATVLGIFPLIIASGAGAVSRYNIGLVITTGMIIGTLFTLFVVPAMYMLIAQTHEAEQGDGEPATTLVT